MICENNSSSSEVPTVANLQEASFATETIGFIPPEWQHSAPFVPKSGTSPSLRVKQLWFTTSLAIDISQEIVLEDGRRVPSADCVFLVAYGANGTPIGTMLFQKPSYNENFF